jgi:tRNA modification GTPase
MDTIFALASARGRAGVAVIRLSGPGSHAAVAALCGPLPAERRASLRALRWNGDLLDEALVLTFGSGSSFTGEESAELQVHGSPAGVARLLQVLGQMPGLRLADAGEFTRRALENGQLDLAQVEGLADLIDAETEAQRRQALRVLSGELGRRVEGWRAGLIRAAALVEATIDFADEEVPQDVTPEVAQLTAAVIADLRGELQRSAGAERIRDGFEVAIVGAPNVGKSSLLNAMARREVAITSEIAGTTRDVIEVRMDIGGLPVLLLDTAGLREAGDRIEQIGIDRAVQRAEAADLRIFLLGKAGESLPVPAREGDLVVTGKADLTGDPAGISGLTGQGLDQLLTEIGRRLSARVPGTGLLIRERHRNAMEQAITALTLALTLLGQRSVQAELVAVELRSAMHHLEMMVGKIGTEALLGEIFASFCIGK